MRLTTSDGVVVLDAPPTIGHNIQRAIDEIAAASGVSNKVNYLIYSHHHADHVGASSPFDMNVTRIRHEETQRVLLRDDDLARRPNEATFQRSRRAHRSGLARRQPLAGQHRHPSARSRDVDADRHRESGWAPIYLSNLIENIPGNLEAANALAYSWTHFIGGHNGRLGTCEELELFLRQ